MIFFAVLAMVVCAIKEKEKSNRGLLILMGVRNLLVGFSLFMALSGIHTSQLFPTETEIGVMTPAGTAVPPGLQYVDLPGALVPLAACVLQKK